MNNEIKLDKSSFLVSETDEKGIIKFANSEFCKFAGYELDELIGQPHNIVRHKDMPAQAFEDLWNTVKNGDKWKGYVKNSTKNGDYYWVFATVFAYKSCDGKNGYISCRKFATDEEIKTHEELYRSMR